MPQDPGRLQRETLSMPDPPDIWVGRYYEGNVFGGSGSYAGITAIPHHFQCGGGCGGASLGVCDGGGRGRAG